MNAFKRIRAGKPAATYSIRFELKGKPYLRKTPYTNAEQALAFGRALRASLEKKDCAALKTALDQSAYRRTAPFATIGQITDAYLALAGPVQQIANPTTIQANTFALRNLLLRVHILPGADRLDARLLTPDQHAQIRHLSTSHLNAHLIAEYKASAFRRAQTKTENQADSAYRSANSILIQARSLFTKPLLDAYKTKGLHLPDLKDFLTKPLFQKVSKDEYHPASDPLLAKTFGALPDLERHDPDAYVAIWLALGFGLRRGEIIKLKTAWFIHHAGGPHLHFQQKTKDNVTLQFLTRCQLDAWPRLQPHVDRARAENREHLLQDNHRNIHSDLWGRLSIWLRDLGWQTQKTLHEFRAYAGCQIAMAHGLLAAKEFLRHKTITTTERYYGRYIRLQIPAVPLTIPQLLPPSIVSNPDASASA